MSNFKDRFVRAVRANLNDVLDRVKQFENNGGFDTLFDQDWDQLGADSGAGQTSSHAPSSRKTIREYYANLEIPYGSDLQTVKDAYRRLMRRYHPDRYADDAEMEALATELSQEISQAYAAITRWLEAGR